VQSFETGNLRQLRTRINVPLIQLLSDTGAPWDLVVTGDRRTYADLATPAGLRSIRTYADGVGVHKDLVIPRDGSGALTRPTSLVADAHAARLVTHAWTFRNENAFLPADLRRSADPAVWGDAMREYELFYATGLDGLFSDFPDAAVLARDRIASDGIGRSDHRDPQHAARPACSSGRSLNPGTRVPS
jgi:glycerophosphoryl diester phosphodiesterase